MELTHKVLSLMENASVSMEDKVELLKKRFSCLADWESRYREMMDLGKQLPPLAAEQKIETFLVKGCQSQVWLVPEYKEGKLFFMADSDSLLVKGIVALLVIVYSGQSPQKIVGYKPEFLKELGITEHLTMNRSNGLLAMIKQMQLYALAYQVMDQSEKSEKMQKKEH